MSIARSYVCDGPDCPSHTKTTNPPPHLPGGYIETREVTEHGEHTHHFCTWDCAMKFGAGFAPPEEDRPYEV